MKVFAGSATVGLYHAAAFLLSIGSLALALGHSHVSCEISGMLVAISGMILISVGILTALTPKSTRRRSIPLIIAIVSSFLVHPLFMH